LLARTHRKGQGIRMSFRGMGKSFPMETRSKGRKRLESRCRPSVGMSFRLAIPWPVALQQSRPPLRQLRASVNQGALGVEKFSANGTLSLNCLSHFRGQVQVLLFSSCGSSLTARETDCYSWHGTERPSHLFEIRPSLGRKQNAPGSLSQKRIFRSHWLLCSGVGRGVPWGRLSPLGSKELGRLPP
jgi:hypothetical protein